MAKPFKYRAPLTEEEQQVCTENVKLIGFYFKKLVGKYPTISFEDVRDLVVYSMIKAVRDWNPEKGKLSTLVGFYANNECKAHLRDQDALKRDSGGFVYSLDNELPRDRNNGAREYHEVIGENDNYSFIDREFLYQGLELLNDRDREYIRLYYFEDMRMSDIAKIYNQSQSYTSRMVTRARENLKLKIATLGVTSL